MAPDDPVELPEGERMNRELQRLFLGDDTNKGKGLVYYLFETQGGSTAMTVLIGGLFATLINSCIQSSIAERQAEQNRAGAKYAIQLEMQKDRIKERSASNKEMVELIGQVVSHTQNLAMTYGPNFDLNRQKEARKEKLGKQIAEIRKTFNETQTAWNKQKDAFQYKIALYYGGNKEAVDAWVKLAGAIDAYLEWVPALDNHPPDYEGYRTKEATIRNLMQELSAKLANVSEKEIQSIR